MSDNPPEFETALQTNFPGVFEAAHFVRVSHSLLQTKNFQKENAIALVSVCRDELTRPFVDAVDKAWGMSFNISSLAGMVLVGKTGFDAAFHHAPTANGIERYVFYVAPHIAVDERGEIGKVKRPGIVEMSSACGALVLLQKELTSGQVPVKLNPVDMEMSLLTQEILSDLQYGQVPSLLELTFKTYEIIVRQVEATLEATIKDTSRCEYAIFAGIQIHGPNGKNYFWPGKAVVFQKNQLTDVKADLINFDTVSTPKKLDSKKSITRLCIAASEGDVEKIRNSVKKDADVVTYVDYDNRTLLHLASINGHVPVVKELLESGANPSTRDRFGHSAIEDAILLRKFDVVPLLREKKAYVSDQFLKANIFDAVKSNNLPLVKALIESSEYPNRAVNITDFEGRTPSHIASFSNLLEIQKYLIKQGADLNKKDNYGNTPLKRAQSKKHTEMINLLEKK